MPHHIERQLEKLKEKVLHLGTLVEEAIGKSILALSNEDTQLAQRVMDSDDDIDRMEVEVEEECLKILALYQPVATDLRFVVSLLKINNDLERMGDLAKNIAKRVSHIAANTSFPVPHEIHVMATHAQEMVRDCLDSVVRGDPVMARAVCEKDDQVDELRKQVYTMVMQTVKNSPDTMDTLLRIDSVSKNIERIGDMATNVAEDVIYMVEGDIVRHRMTD